MDDKNMVLLHKPCRFWDNGDRWIFFLCFSLELVSRKVKDNKYKKPHKEMKSKRMGRHMPANTKSKHSGLTVYDKKPSDYGKEFA